jgi:aldose 1-epimerase
MKVRKITSICTTIALLVLVLSSCNNNQTPGKVVTVRGITKTPWGNTDGEEVFLYTLVNAKGTVVKVSNYGGTVTAWLVKDKNDSTSNIVLGFDSLSGYLAKPPYFGALIGRYGNRIAKGKFKIDTATYTLATNNTPNHLHGGNKGFDKVVWGATIQSDTLPTLLLSYFSKDGEEGYPGNLTVKVNYTLTDNDELKIVYDAETDKPTVVNLTNHAYFNLTGDIGNTILDHRLQVAADNYTPVDSTLIPTGEIKTVKGSPFDFIKAEKIGLRINAIKGGYDHNFVLNKKDAALSLVASLWEDKTGRVLEVFTTEPGLQFYTGNFLDGTIKSSAGQPIQQHTGLCLETQHFPNSPNEPKFPSTMLKPGQKYHTETVYKVSVNK